MARRKHSSEKQGGVQDFRHEQARRKNNPPAGIAPTYEVRERQTTHYAYDPHRDTWKLGIGMSHMREYFSLFHILGEISP